MRSDMAKVLMERPRWNPRDSGRGRLDDLRRTPPEDWRSRESIKARWRGNRKGFTDLLGPIRRFLRSNVGRPWDKVYSEICAEVRSGFPEREHFKTHIFHFVKRDVILIDGAPCERGGHAHGSPLLGHSWGSFYVCPRTGLLREAPRRLRRSK